MAIPQPTAQAGTQRATPVECHLARVQLRRYMSGDELPEPLFGELTAHLQACPDCKDEALRLRDALSSVMPGAAAVEPAPDAQPGTGLLGRIQALPMGRIAEAFREPKTVALSVALAIVLVLLTTVFRDPARLLGPKAAASAAAKEEAKKAEQPAAEAPAEEPEAHAAGHDEAPHGDDAGGAKEDLQELAATDGHDAAAPHEAGHAEGHKARAAKVERQELAKTPVGGSIVVAKPAAKPSASPARATARKAASKPAPKRRAQARKTANPAAAPKPASPAEPYVRVHGD